MGCTAEEPRDKAGKTYALIICMQATDFKEKKHSGVSQNGRLELRASVDHEGRIILPPEVRSHYGLQPGAQIFIDEAGYGLRLRWPVTHLAKVYVEPTNCCNLECRTCIRNVWDEPLGKISGTTFERIIEGLRGFSPVPTVFFGGFGEPLAHPDIERWWPRPRPSARRWN